MTQWICVGRIKEEKALLFLHQLSKREILYRVKVLGKGGGLPLSYANVEEVEIMVPKSRWKEADIELFCMGAGMGVYA